MNVIFHVIPDSLFFGLCAECVTGYVRSVLYSEGAELNCVWKSNMSTNHVSHSVDGVLVRSACDWLLKREISTFVSLVFFDEIETNLHSPFVSSIEICKQCFYILDWLFYWNIRKMLMCQMFWQITLETERERKTLSASYYSVYVSGFFWYFFHSPLNTYVRFMWQASMLTRRHPASNL